MRLTYHRNGDYLYPNLVVEDEPLPIGKYGMLRETYLREYHPALYHGMLLDGTLKRHLYEIDQAASDRIDRIIEGLVHTAGITETLKASDMLEWVRRMNNVKSRAEEIVLSELVYN